ncbi:MAG: TonB family protein [Acidobacteriia bacterium]|nr:TonB family protein [Terriglobia bacterium]
MFEDALLESSPGRSPVLHRIHYLLSALVGTLVCIQGLYLLPLVLAPAGARALHIAAGIVGTVAAAYALMLCYVWADTKQQRLRTWPWFVATLALNTGGFLIYLVYSAARTGDWRRAAIPLAYVAEALLVGVLVLVPLIYTQALPVQMLVEVIHVPPPPAPPPAPAPSVRATPRRTVDWLRARIVTPDRVVQSVENPEPPPTGHGTGPWVIGGIPTGAQATPGILNGVPWGMEPPPPPEPRVAAKPRMIRVGGEVIAARGLHQPKPVYPPMAIMAHVQGTVVLQAIIGRDGAVQDLKVLSGPALLIRAAKEAVKTWRYQPMLLNGEPVDVLTEVSVNFTLAE